MASTSKLPPTMRAWQFASNSPSLVHNLKFNSKAPLPKGADAVPADKVLVQVHAVSLNPVDYKFPEIPVVGRLMTGSPATPAIDFAGRVVALGASSGKVQGAEVRPGDLVWGRLDGPTQAGTLADYTIAPRSGLAKIPQGLDLVDIVASGTVALTAYQSIVPHLPAIKEAGVRSPRLFINGGSGGTGTFGIQFAKILGCHVTVSCSGSNSSLCKALGADTIIDYRSQDLLTALKEESPFDLVVDNVGKPADLYWNAHLFTKPGAPYVQVGAEVSLAFVYDALMKFLWPTWGGRRPFEFLGVTTKVDELEQIGKWMQEGKVRAVIDEVFDFEEKGPIKAYEKLQTGRVVGKVVVKVADKPGK